MQLRTFTPWLIGACALALSACNPPSTQNEQAKLSWLNTTPIPLKDHWQIASTPQQGAWFAYYQGQSSLFLNSPQGVQQTLVDGSQGAAPSGLALALNEKGPATMWRDKVPDKGLYFKQGDAPAKELGVEGFDTEPLARFDLKPDGQGWHVLWYGEHIDPKTQSRYNIYYRHVDAQSNASATELLMPGFYPNWLADEKGNIAVFSWDNTQSPPKMIMRVRDATSGQFGAIQTLAKTTTSIPPLMRTYHSGSRWFVLWIDQLGEGANEFLLRGLWSDDQGVQWNDFDFPTIKGFDISDLQISHDDQTGHQIMAISGTWRFKDPSAKNTFYISQSQDRGTHWSEPQLIRDDQTNTDSRAEAAQVFFGEKPGSAWLVWEDWRAVRARLFFAYSEDYGVSWKHKNLPLAVQPEGNNLLATQKGASYRDAQGLHLAAANVTSDVGIEKKVFSLPINNALLEQSLKLAEKGSSVGNEQALKNRVTTYWKALADSNYESSYSYLDPFIHAAWPVTIYKQRLGMIKYREKITIDSVQIHGHFADVNLRVTAYVPEFEMAGKKHSAPDREVAITERWLWIDGNWFREYSEESSEIKFTRYQ
jgi:hypothetical protein